VLIAAAPARSDTTDGSGTAAVFPDAACSAASNAFAKAKVIAMNAKRVFMRGIPYFPATLFGKFRLKSQSHSGLLSSSKRSPDHCQTGKKSDGFYMIDLLWRRDAASQKVDREPPRFARE